MSKDRVWSLNERTDYVFKVASVILGVIRGWRNVITVAMATKVQQDAPKFGEPPCDKTPHTTVTAIAVKAEKRRRTLP